MTGGDMKIWRRLIAGGLEYAPAERILAGLELEHVGARPGEGLHSIYDELFHTAHWQRVMLGRAQGAARTHPDAEWPSAPLNKAAWSALVSMFLADAEAAAALAERTEGHGDTLADGRTVREELECLAVHNAYHMGKIVLLRQLLGVWTPPPDDA